MVARPIDAAEGYELFLRHDGRVELDEINEYLRGIGLREVSPRMYSHYQKLKRYGYESYIPINRLDLAVAGEYAWSDDMRALLGDSPTARGRSHLACGAPPRGYRATGRSFRVRPIGRSAARGGSACAPAPDDRH